MAKEKKKEKKKKGTSQISKEPRTYFPEALLAFQIQIKEDVIDQLLGEIRQLEAENERSKERNQQLKSEQIEHIRALLAALKEQEKELENIEIVTRDDVEKAMMSKWQYIKDQEKLIRDMRFQIHYVEQKLVQKQTEIDYWTAYKNVGCTEHGSQIQFLEQDIKKLKEDLEEMKEFFRISLEEAKERIDKTTLRQLELKKEWATENAVKHIDKISRREIKEYEWLKEEVEAYRKEVDGLEQAVHEIEKENIYLINKLFERRLQFLKVPRKLFLTQGAGLKFPGESMDQEEEEERVQSAKDLVLSADPESSEEIREPEEQLVDDFEVVYLRGMSTNQFLPPLLYEDTNDFKDYKELGPLDMKLMCAVGQKMPIHEDLKEMPSKSQLEERYDPNKASQHITYRMIKSVFP
ncbi:coiled-coil domain-containing protein 83 [Thamnophis elegans]|uniref:coiled-coil domain-containing protein 83 n=1 Tax=Thamnophis elegans TaxID=35005 RepID=UPI0013782C03|nr:coiled-coil domain-containing protein 83 [Thamnophis elegans]